MKGLDWIGAQCSNTSCNRSFVCSMATQGDSSGVICPRCYVATPEYHIVPKVMAASFYRLPISRLKLIYACVLCESAGRTNHSSITPFECMDCVLRAGAFQDGRWWLISARSAQKVADTYGVSLEKVTWRLRLLSAGAANVVFPLAK